MTIILILLALIVGTGAILYVHHRLTYTPDSEPGPSEPEAGAGEGEQCCGLHLTCEKGLPQSSEIIYYDDEELDAFALRPPESYTEAETELFRDVLLTLLPSDIAGWNHSLELRQIALPGAVRQEMMLIISELRS